MFVILCRLQEDHFHCFIWFLCFNWSNEGFPSSSSLTFDNRRDYKIRAVDSYRLCGISDSTLKGSYTYLKLGSQQRHLFFIFFYLVNWTIPQRLGFGFVGSATIWLPQKYADPRVRIQIAKYLSKTATKKHFLLLKLKS